MPHNLFLHSEVIQSREWNLEDESVIKKQLKYEFYDTLLSMVIGWAINSAMIILAAATFFKQNIAVDELSAMPENLINAHRMADSVICLPMHHALGDGDIKRVLDCIM